MLMRFAVPALVLYIVGAVRVTENNAEGIHDDNPERKAPPPGMPPKPKAPPSVHPLAGSRPKAAIPAGMPPQGSPQRSPVPPGMPPQSTPARSPLPAGMPPQSTPARSPLPAGMPPQSTPARSPLPAGMPPQFVPPRSPAGTTKKWGTIKAQTKRLHPERDPKILNRIKNVAFVPNSGGSGLPALVPRQSEGVCSYYFGIKEVKRGFQTWYLAGMRVTRTGDMGDCEDVDMKHIPLAALMWEGMVDPKRFIVKSLRSKKELMRIQQERKGKYVFRILPPETDEAAKARYTITNDQTDDHQKLYSGSRHDSHHWTAYRGNQQEETAVEMDCSFRTCGIEKAGGEDTLNHIGSTEQTKPDDPDAAVYTRKDVTKLDVDVDVMFNQDSGLLLALSSTMTHKYRPARTGIGGAVEETLFGNL